MRVVMTLLLCGVSFCAAAEVPEDPLASPGWRYMHARFIGDAPMVFDERVEVLMPPAAEDPLGVPVMVRAPGLSDVEQVIVFADLNPIVKILEFEPLSAQASIGFRFKVEQATPVRAAMRTRDGVWHLGGAWLEANGGGCTAPSAGSSNSQLLDHLGEVEAALWPRGDEGQRLRFKVTHPMDTGLAGGIPVFYLEDVAVSDLSGKALARLKLYEPISENPTLSLDLRHVGPVQISGRDIHGNQFSASVAP